MEKKRQKTLEKEAEQARQAAEVKERPAWRDDEESEPEEELLQDREGVVPSPDPSPEPEPQSIPPPVPPQTRVSRFRSMSPHSQVYMCMDLCVYACMLYVCMYMYECVCMHAMYVHVYVCTYQYMYA